MRALKKSARIDIHRTIGSSEGLSGQDLQKVFVLIGEDRHEVVRRREVLCAIQSTTFQVRAEAERTLFRHDSMNLPVFPLPNCPKKSLTRVPLLSMSWPSLHLYVTCVTAKIAQK